MGKIITQILALLCVGWCLLLTVWWFGIIADVRRNGWEAFGFGVFFVPATVIVALPSVILPAAYLYRRGRVREERLPLWVTSIGLIVVVLEALALTCFNYDGCC